MEIQSCLKEIMEERGLKQTWLAKKIGVRPTTINDLVSGKRLPSLPVALSVAKVLELKIEDIWNEKTPAD